MTTRRVMGGAWLWTLLAALALLATSPLAAAGQEKQVEIILDCSGSMKNRLASGQTRIAAARQAVEDMVPRLDPKTMLAFRAYGHQSPTAKHDCQDIQLLEAFAPAAQNGARVVEQAKTLPARGYTPITQALELAARDFPAGAPGQRVIILVSDGKETCDGNPCRAAKALAETHQVLIHTVGLGVEAATRSQLQCIARASGGRYFPAESAKELADSLLTAVQTGQVRQLPKPGYGLLKIKGADLMGHQVTKAETGELVATLSHVQDTVKLPSGLYNVSVGQGQWPAVEIKADQTTLLEPAVLSVQHAALAGNPILDPETGQEMGQVSNTKASIAMLPGDYEVGFGLARWPVRLKAGQRLVLNPGLVVLKGAKITGHAIRDDQGREVGRVSATGNSMALPPGQYSLDLGARQESFSLQEGQRLEFRL